MSLHRTRLAPSPTGALHLGNARTFLVNWALARQQGWHIVLRIEDLDSPRIKPGVTDETIETLSWLGIDWDEGPYFQLVDLTPYEEAVAQLASEGEAYSCRCTRGQIETASLSAPHGDEHELRYPGTCRPPHKEPISLGGCPAEAAIRLRVPDGTTRFNDHFAGEQEFNVQQSVGDFLVRTKNQLPSYQLAVVVDDARQKIDQIVRGDDLLSSTPRQMLLYEKLRLGRPPSYTHLPLVVGPDGRRLAKRHGDSRINHYREMGVAAEKIIGLIADWCGVGIRTSMSASEFLNRFQLQQIPHEPIVFTADDDAWLMRRT